MRILLAVISLLVVVACGADADLFTVTADDSGDELVVSSGDRIEVSLESNPSTGYSWQVDDRAVAAFTSIGSSEYRAPDDGDQVGAAGVEVLTVEVIGRGAGVLRLEYVRPFDDLPVPERVVEYIVRSDGAPWPPDDVEPVRDTSTASAPTPLEITDVPSSDEPVDIAVIGFVVWDTDVARLCENLLESAPPRCGGASIVLTDPEALDIDLDELQGVRWTNDRIVVTGRLEHGVLTLAT